MALLLSAGFTYAQGSFTYQGLLRDTNGPVTGAANMQFQIYQAATGGLPLWQETHTAVLVSNGFFSVTLGNTIAISSAVFSGAPRWLAVSINGNVELAPRTQLGATPYAITAGNLSGLVPSNSLAGTYSAPVIFDSPRNSFIGNGLGLTLNASQLSGGIVPDARLSTNIARTDEVWSLKDITPASFNTIVYVPAAGHLTNVLANASNDMIIQLAVGTNRISAFQGANNQGFDAHLRLVAKTNVTIRGHGWGSVIDSATIGTMISISHCYGITIENCAIIGTRASFNYPTPLFSAINIYGTNNYLTFRNVWFKNHADHAIVQGSGPGPEGKNSADVLVENCVFEDIGATNYNVGADPDGVAVNIVGTRQRVRGNKFIRCRLGIEFEGTVVTPIEDAVIEDNYFLDGLQTAIINFSYAQSPGDYRSTSIRNNVFRFNRAIGWGGQMHGIHLEGFAKCEIEGNTFQNTDFAISLLTYKDAASNWTIKNNSIRDAASFGIILSSYDATRLVDTLQITGNYLTNTFWDGIILNGITRSLIAGNVFDNVNVGGNGGASLRIQPGVTFSSGNRVVNNIFARSASASPIVVFAAGTTNNHVERNEFMHVPTVPWIDLGAGNEFRNNWIGTNLAVRSVVLDLTGVTNCTPDMTIGSPGTAVIRLAALSPMTLNATTSISDGYFDRQSLELVGTSDVNTVTIIDGSNVELPANVTLGANDSLTLEYSAVDGIWRQKAASNN
ncbi:MAG TPA: right-handed parallel beta-helix repeat-containing protein [Verrucomicrobiae bacterium]|nr:right-handed parallel beta-helix repeat-containing protein [Verrucomicrobiae bacterium]